MLLILGYFLISVSFVSGKVITWERKGYDITIDNGILMFVNKTSDASEVLDLHYMDIKGIDRKAFNGLENVKTLNLAKNEIKTLPEYVFLALANLEHLSLRNNKLETFYNAFLGLKKLKTLNLLRNPALSLNRHSFEGLDESVVIRAQKKLNVADPSLFEKKSKPLVLLCGVKNDFPHNAYSYLLRGNWVKWVKLFDDNIENHREIVKNCDNINRVEIKSGVLHLENFYITGCDKGWYQLQDETIHSLELSNNRIYRLEVEILNDLPKNVAYVYLRKNLIEALEKENINNKNLIHLDFDDCEIYELWDGPFNNTSLETLILSSNNLDFTSFIEALPNTIKELNLAKNMITSLPSNTFSRLNKLQRLNLEFNRIKRLDEGAFNGLKKIEVINIANNRLTNITQNPTTSVGTFPNTLKELNLAKNMIDVLIPDTFSKLGKLKNLNLEFNRIKSLDKGVFNGLKSIEVLNVANNRISNINGGSFHGIPRNKLEVLELHHNEIGRLKKRTFVSNVISKIDLSHNNITKIESGSFDLPQLTYLHLSNNLLTTLEQDTLVGLPKVTVLDLRSNNLKTIKKGVRKNLGKNVLVLLDDNPAINDEDA